MLEVAVGEVLGDDVDLVPADAENVVELEDVFVARGPAQVVGLAEGDVEHLLGVRERLEVLRVDVKRAGAIVDLRCEAHTHRR